MVVTNLRMIWYQKSEPGINLSIGMIERGSFLRRVAYDFQRTWRRVDLSMRWLFLSASFAQSIRTQLYVAHRERQLDGAC